MSTSKKTSRSNPSKSVGIIGAGNMGGALVKGWVSGRWPKVIPKNIVIIDPHPGGVALELIEQGASHHSEPDQALSEMDIILLSVKPQIFSPIQKSLSALISQKSLIISIMAGISLTDLETIFTGRAIVRAMPNTPAAIGEGVSAYVCGSHVREVQRALVDKWLAVTGPAIEVDNDHMIDVVTAVSGSGPAYIFHMVEALESAAISAGMPAELAPQFARQTVIGAAALMKHDERSVGELRRAVTSPNGTTQAALDVLMGEQGLAMLMRDTVNAALMRAKELASKD